ncbi:MAG TPA: hypothetical protein VJ933_05665 [Phaeodactylibacter sp.]|nr:hypothetical protein [Phaeodactylibacter sp.]
MQWAEVFRQGLFGLGFFTGAQVTIYAYFNPFVALFFGWLLLDELLSLELLLSFGITL